jgi:hypothetical protein
MGDNTEWGEKRKERGKGKGQASYFGIEEGRDEREEKYLRVIFQCKKWILMISKMIMYLWGKGISIEMLRDAVL